MRLKELLPPIDRLGEALHYLRMSGVFCCSSEFSEPWALDLPPFEDSVMFHGVTEGRCRIEAPGAGAGAEVLEEGDFALVPHGAGHRLAGGDGISAAQLFDLPREVRSERYEVLRHGGGGAPARVLCGAVRFEHPAARDLLRSLPGLIVLRARDARGMDLIGNTLRLIAAEARDLRPGGEAVITRLSDILVVEAIRSWIQERPEEQSGWLGALKDRQIGRALAVIHRHPERRWTLASLATVAAMSRSAFAARFKQEVGETAMHHVTRWRMYQAFARLREDSIPIAELAERLGYQSEAAFSRAFKRAIGTGPGAVRRRTSAHPPRKGRSSG